MRQRYTRKSITHRTIHTYGGAPMLVKRVIACLDVNNGKVVKGVQFRQHEVIGDILPLAEKYAAEGADELVFYDISASDRKSTRLNSSHVRISYAVFCLKKKNYNRSARSSI